MFVLGLLQSLSVFGCHLAGRVLVLLSQLLDDLLIRARSFAKLDFMLLFELLQGVLVSLGQLFGLVIEFLLALDVRFLRLAEFVGLGLGVLLKLLKRFGVLLAEPINHRSVSLLELLDVNLTFSELGDLACVLLLQ